MNIRRIALICGIAWVAATLPAGAQAVWEGDANRWAQATPATRMLTWARQAPQVDFDDDGVVGFSDFLLFVKSYGSASGAVRFDERMDLNADGAVDFADFLSFGAVYNGQADEAPEQAGYTIYVADFGDGSLTSIDSESHLVTDYITFRGPSSVRISSDGQTIYISEGFGLFAIDAGHEALFSVPTASHGRIAMSPDEQTLYLTQEASNQLIAVSVSAQAAVDTVQVGDTPVDVDITPDGRWLYVANFESRDITVIDAVEMAVAGRIDLGSRPREIAITPDGRRAFVTDPDRGVLSVVDLTTNLVVGGIPLSGDLARGLAFSPDGKTLYVASEEFLVAIDVARNMVSRTLRIGDDTSTVAVTPDGLRVYVASLLFTSGGTGISVIDVADWRILGRIRGPIFPSEIRFRSAPFPTAAQ